MRILERYPRPSQNWGVSRTVLCRTSDSNIVEVSPVANRAFSPLDWISQDDDDVARISNIHRHDFARARDVSFSGPHLKHEPRARQRQRPSGGVMARPALRNNVLPLTLAPLHLRSTTFQMGANHALQRCSRSRRQGRRERDRQR